MNLAQENLNEINSIECSICLEELNNGHKNRVLQCGHIFHSACVDPWIKQNFNCPYCRHCETYIDCYWLSLKDYGLSWLNKLRKYKYTLKKDHIEISRKKYIYRINLQFIERVYSKNNTIIFSFLDGTKSTLWFRNAYAPFMALKRCLNDYYERQRLEIQRQQIQYQIQQIERFRPRLAWTEEPQLENGYPEINTNGINSDNGYAEIDHLNIENLD